MPEKEPQKEESTSSEAQDKKNEINLESGEFDKRKKQWREFEDRFKTKTDVLGYEIEDGIFDAVVGLNALDINTDASCEGHADKGRIAPWVDIEAPNKLKNKYIAPKETEKDAYLEKGISEDLFDKFKNLEIRFREEIEKGNIKRVELIEELLDETQITREEWGQLNTASKIVYEERHVLTPKYKKWLEENDKLKKRTKKLIDEFNQDRNTPENLSIMLETPGLEWITIYNGRNDYERRGKKEKETTEQEKKELEERLVQYREEFKKFAEFLKEKYFQRQIN